MRIVGTIVLFILILIVVKSLSGCAVIACEPFAPRANCVEVL
jgi:uncharacterized ion transporter superfamily protein YfcC